MPSRFIPFVNGQLYHLYNRGTAKRPIFHSRRDYQRFVKTVHYYQVDGRKPKFSRYFPNIHKLDFSKKSVEILCYCLMPNHFHLLIRQVRDGGITEFMSKTSNSYTKYHNTKYDSVGPLLQGEFKAVIIEDDNQLIHVSRYIHLNPFIASLTKDIQSYEWSSLGEYISNNQSLCNIGLVLGLFKSPQEYLQFIQDQASYAQEIEAIKHKLIE